MNRSGDLLEVPSQDGRLLWLGVEADYQFGPDGAKYSLPILMWAVGQRDTDGETLVLDSEEPFVSVSRAVQLAPSEVESIIAACHVLVQRTRVDLEVVGFWSGHPYRVELQKFLASVARIKRAHEKSDRPVELKGRSAAKVKLHR